MPNVVTTGSVLMLLLVIVSFASAEAHKYLKQRRESPARRIGPHPVEHSHERLSAYLVRGDLGSQVKALSGGWFGSIFINRSKSATSGGPDPIHHEHAHVRIERQSPAIPDTIHHYNHERIEEQAPEVPITFHRDSNLPKFMSNKLPFERMMTKVPGGPNHIHHKEFMT